MNTSKLPLCLCGSVVNILLSNKAMKRDDKPARQPLFWAALAFSAGIWTGTRAWRPALWWTAAILGLSLAALWFVGRRQWLAKALSLAPWVLLGALFIQARGPSSTNASELLALAGDRETLITAHVIREGYAQAEAPNSTRQTADLETEAIETEDGATRPVRIGLRLTTYEKVTPTENAAAESLNLRYAEKDPGAAGSTALSTMPYGARLRVRAKLHAPRNFRNPGAFDYEGYLRDRGISVLGSARAENVERLPGFFGNAVELWRSRIHASVVTKVHALWPAQQAALIDAMVLGEDAFLQAGTRVEFQRSGTYHVLVVSGMNLSILAFVIFWSLRQFRVDPALAGIATVLASFAYAFLTNVGAPVWRAALMLTFYLGARLLYRERSMMNAIGAAGLGVLAVDPRALLGASFQLTFLSVAIIAAIGVPLLERTSLPYARGLRLLQAKSYDLHVAAPVAQFRLDLRLVAERLRRFVGVRLALAVPASLIRVLLAGFELVLISLLMQIGLALPMAYYFHRATSMGIPANLLVVPLTAVLMPAAAAAVVLGYVSATLAAPAAWISGLALEAITGTVRWLGSARIADLRVATPQLSIVIAGMAALALAMSLARRHRVLAAGGVVALAAVAAWIAFGPSRPQVRPGVLEVTAIDVGQGDSTLLVTPDGHTVLIDAGGLPLWMHSQFDMGEQVVSPYLWSRGWQRLDAVAITHAHADHLGGMLSVTSNFGPRELWIGSDTPDRELGPILEQARRAGMMTKLLKSGDSFDYGGAQFRVLAPERDEGGRIRANDDSLALTVGFAGSVALLEGDVERATERRIVQQRPQATLLKVAHHGSASATSSELLATVRPQFAVISAGARNVYGHPRPEVLRRLQEAGVRTYRTDRVGAVSFYFDGRSVSAEVALSR